MKFACIPFCRNEYVLNNELLLWEVSCEEANRLIEGFEKGSSFIEELRSSGLNGEFGEYVTFPVALTTTVFGANSDECEALLGDLAYDEWVHVPDKFDPWIPGADIPQETYLHRVTIYEDAISIEADLKGDNDSFEAPNLSIEALKRIADGDPPESIRSADVLIGSAVVQMP